MLTRPQAFAWSIVLAASLAAAAAFTQEPATTPAAKPVAEMSAQELLDNLVGGSWRLGGLPEVAPTAVITVTRAAAADGKQPSRPEVTVLNGKTPLDNFRELERLIEVEGQPGDQVRIRGVFVAGPLDILDLNRIAGGELTGFGPERSRLVFTAQHDRIGPAEKPDKPGGPALWFPTNGTIRVAGMYLENTPANVNEDGALAGWPGGNPGVSEHVLLEDLLVKAHDWGFIYEWCLRSKRTITLRRVKGVAARSFISLMHSGSTYQLALEDCELGIDGNLSRSIGASSNSDLVTGGVLTPIILRAGSGVADGCTFWVKDLTPPAGHPAKWIPRRIVNVATDQYYSQGAKDTTFTAVDCRRIAPEVVGAKIVTDLDFRWGKKPTWNNRKLVDQVGEAVADPSPVQIGVK